MSPPPDIRLPEDPGRQFEAHLFFPWSNARVSSMLLIGLVKIAHTN
jgi:hypothetical protein